MLVLSRGKQIKFNSGDNEVSDILLNTDELSSLIGQKILINVLIVSIATAHLIVLNLNGE